jgi:hypothetical protein
VVEISVDVEALDLVQAFNLILRLSADTVTFQDSDIEVASEAESVKVLTGHDYTSSTGERVVNEISGLDLAHIGHQES